MTAPLPPEAADKLAKVCGMLGSAHDGERAAAAAKATEMLQSLGITWRDVIEAAATPPKRDDGGGGCLTADDWAEVIADILNEPPHLHSGEHDFLTAVLELARCGRRPSRKQAAWLDKIARRR